MVYILFVLISGYNGNGGISLESVTIEMSSKESCLAAGKVIAADIHKARGNVNVISWGCVQK